MYEFIWKLLLWPAAVLSGGMAGLSAVFWVGDKGTTDRIIDGIVCGLLAAVFWLMIISAIRRLAER
jgi:hypothetical protein